ncbi:MAG: RNA methyltransferase, partial [Chloroflexi bacterium]|nr:RNA methyltransferase [Chloroflexota bacterium]
MDVSGPHWQQLVGRRETLTSLQNPQVKHVVRLRDRRARDEARELVIEGARALRRALDSGYRPHTVYFAPNRLTAESEVLLADAAGAGAALWATSEPVLVKMAYRSEPEGILGVGPYLDTRLEHMALSSAASLLVVAVSIAKPGNLGAILRSADAVGADGLVLCDGGTDIHNPNVVWASTGTLFGVPVAEASSAEARAWLRANGVCVLAADPQAATVYTQADLRRPTAIVVGEEHAGLGQWWLEQADLGV